MRSLLTFLALSFFYTVYAQTTCLPVGIAFSSQTQIDNFQADYPGCTEITGYVTIDESFAGNITNLNGLNVITAIGGNLSILNNTALPGLSGLDNMGIAKAKYIYLRNSSNLFTCEVLSVCNHIDEGGPTVITGNATGCNSVAEVEAACALAFPVEWISFRASLIGRDVELLWETASEINNCRFEVENSQDGKAFITIGSIPGMGASTETAHYRFTHHGPPVGINYYRLKQVDLDGHYEYSPLISLLVESGEASLYPNPSSGRVYVSLPSAPSDGHYRLVLYSLMNEMVYSQGLPAGRSAPTEVALPGDFPNGIYLWKVIGPARLVAAGKLMLIK